MKKSPRPVAVCDRLAALEQQQNKAIDAVYYLTHASEREAQGAYARLRQTHTAEVEHKLECPTCSRVLSSGAA